jgi:hypothetical protein
VLSLRREDGARKLFPGPGRPVGHHMVDYAGMGCLFGPAYSGWACSALKTFSCRSAPRRGPSPVRRMGQQRLLVGLWRAGNQRGAMTACCRSKASGHVIAQQSDACGMAAVSQRQRAAGGGGVLRIGERRLSAESDVRQIVDEFRYHPPRGGT